MGITPNANEPMSGAKGPLGNCPTCGATELLTVHDWEDTNFLCTSCGRCWHVAFSQVYRVDPLTCAGCLHKPECLARFGADLPSD